nr:PREDICTED: uncharacterized protein LOC109450436 isoform X1 [Rhinolophus sinicus]
MTSTGLLFLPGSVEGCPTPSHGGQRDFCPNPWILHQELTHHSGMCELQPRSSGGPGTQPFQQGSCWVPAWKRQRHAQCLDGSVGPGDPPRPSRAETRHPSGDPQSRGWTGKKQGTGRARERQRDRRNPRRHRPNQRTRAAGPVQSPQDTHPYTQVHPRKHTPRDPDHRHEFTSRTYPETHTLCSGVCPTRAACEDPSLSTNLEGRSDLARFLPPSSHFPHSFPVLSAQGSPGSRSTDPGSWNEHPISRIERSPEELCKMKDFLGRREREQGSLLGKKPGHSGQCLVVFPVCKP